jgi:pimeloyl-ACP methyl ester carboxylesterase
MPYALRRPRLWYERSGTGDPLLLITGFTISSAIFDPIVGLYEPRFDCIRYDHRGSGRSGAPAWPTSMPELAADAVRLLDALGVESAHVYGLSMGGMVAQELAIRFPERVRGLVLGCSTPGGPRAVRPTLREWKALAGAMAGGLREPGRPWLAGALFSPEFRRDHPERVRELLRFFAAHRAPPHGALGHLLASVYHDTVSRLDRIRSPTLVLHGEHDSMAPLANARLLAERIPDAELRIVPGAGHAYGLERPEQSRDLMLEWLDRRGPIAAGAPRGGLAATAEPLTRALGLPIGALRTGRSLAGLVGHRIARRGDSAGTEDDEGGSDVAVDRRAA